MNLAELRARRHAEALALREQPPAPALEWRERAACHDWPVEVFYPNSENADAYRTARAVCETCTVQLHCLSWAVANAEPYGMWGGHTRLERGRLTPNERRVLARHQRAIEREEAAG